MGDEQGQPPRCLSCRHFYVTWDKRFPRGCRCFAIQSRKFPSSEVLAATGIPCPRYEKDPRIADWRGASGWGPSGWGPSGRGVLV